MRHKRRYKKRLRKGLPLGKMEYLEVDGLIDLGNLGDSEPSEDDYPLARRHEAKKSRDDRTPAQHEPEESDDDEPLSRRRKRGGSEDDELLSRCRKRKTAGKSKQLTSASKRMQQLEDSPDELFLPSSPQNALEVEAEMDDNPQEPASNHGLSNARSLKAKKLPLSKTPVVSLASIGAPKSAERTAEASTSKIIPNSRPAQVPETLSSPTHVTPNAVTYSQTPMSKEPVIIGRDVPRKRSSIPKEPPSPTHEKLATNSSYNTKATTPATGSPDSTALKLAKTGSIPSRFPVATPKERQGLLSLQCINLLGSG